MLFSNIRKEDASAEEAGKQQTAYKERITEGSGDFNRHKLGVKMKEQKHGRSKCVEASTIMFYQVPCNDDQSYSTQYSEESKEQFDGIMRREQNIKSLGRNETNDDSSEVFLDDGRPKIIKEPQYMLTEESTLSSSGSENEHNKGDMPSSVRAGERLYHQAMERFDRLRSMKEKEIQDPKPKVISICEDRLYQLATKRTYRPKSLSRLRNNENRSKSTSTPSPISCDNDRRKSREKKSLPIRHSSIPNRKRLNNVHDSIIQDDKSHSISSSSSSCSSIIAGNRLFNQAMERLKRLEKVKKEANEVPPPTLTLYPSRVEPKNPITKPRYLHLYEQAKVKKGRQSTSSSSLSVKKSSSNSSNNSNFDRLYERSKRLQIEGKKRRERIAKASKAREEVPLYMTRKISLKEAEKMYYRGIRHLLDLDIRRFESANVNQTDFQPHRFNKEVTMKALKIDSVEGDAGFEIFM